MKRYVAYLFIALLSFVLSLQVQGQTLSRAHSSVFSQITADSTIYPIYFQKNSLAVNKDYLDNDHHIARINDQLLRLGEGDSITIYVYSSPEGSPIYNNLLTERRAKATRDFVLGNICNPTLCDAYA